MALTIMGTRYYTANCLRAKALDSEIPGSNPGSATHGMCVGGQVIQHLSYFTRNLGVLIIQTD